MLQYLHLEARTEGIQRIDMSDHAGSDQRTGFEARLAEYVI